MNCDAWPVLHGRYGQLSLLDYLFRVLWYLLVVVVIVGAVHLCVAVLAALTQRP